MSEGYTVLFNFTAEEEDEIDLLKGEVGGWWDVGDLITWLVFQVVTVLSKDVGDENYWKGESNGRQGLFPHRFVEKEKYKTLYDFKAEDDDELNLEAGQVSFDSLGYFLRCFYLLDHFITGQGHRRGRLVERRIQWEDWNIPR